MSDSTEDFDDDDKLTPMEEWRAIHYRACSICGSEEILDSMTVPMPVFSDAKPGPGNFIRLGVVTCTSCGFTIFVARKMVEPPSEGK